METPVRKFSFSSDISDLPSSPEADDRIERIREALRQKEIEGERRREAFQSRCRQVRKRIDTLQKARIQKLLENGINIDMDVIRCTLSKEALLWKKKFEKEEREQKHKDEPVEIKTPETKIPDIHRRIVEKVPEVTPKITEEPIKNNDQSEGEKLLLSVKDELAKINKRPAEKQKKVAREKGKKPENQNRRQSLVIAVAEEKNDLASKDQPASSENKKTPLSEFNRREMRRRSSLTMEMPPNLPGRRRSSLDASSPLLQRRRSSETIEPSKLADFNKGKTKGRRRSVHHEPPMWGDILKMGKENEKKDKKKKK